MTKTFRIATLIASAAFLAAAPAAAQVSPSQQATAAVSVKKPLLLTHVADMNFGQVLISGSGTFTSSVSIAQDGTLTCPATYFTCSGTTSPAKYNVSGNKQQVVLVSVPSTLTLTTPASDQLTMTVSAPTQITLTNSGYPGTDFGIGGTLPITNNTSDGAYSATFNVTAQYQ